MVLSGLSTVVMIVVIVRDPGRFILTSRNRWHTLECARHMTVRRWCGGPWSAGVSALC